MSSTRTIYLMRWRRHSDFDATADAFGRCVTSFAERTGTQQVDRVEQSPWRAYGPNWPPDMLQAVQDAIASVAGQ
jgi:hypothetical protein